MPFFVRGRKTGFFMAKIMLLEQALDFILSLNAEKKIKLIYLYSLTALNHIHQADTIEKPEELLPFNVKP